MSITQVATGRAGKLNHAAIHAKAVELGKLVLRMTTAAGSGHPSTALALAHVIVELMYRRMRYDPKDPWNPASDRLVLSAGHGVPIIYAAYADLGGAVGTDSANPQFLQVDDVLTLRELNSVLDGHPNPAEGFPFFDAATGSLGQGVSVAAGLALAARLDGIDKRIYVIVGDGESREGQIWEATDLISDEKLTNVCIIFSCNGHGQASPVSPQQSPEALVAKAEAFGFRAVEVDGHDPAALAMAFDQLGETDRPLALVARTVKGWGAPMMQKMNYHGKPLPASALDEACAQLDATGKELGALTGEVGRPASPPATLRTENRSPKAMPSFESALQRVGLAEALSKRKLATRVAYGAALVSLGDVDPRVVALDGDVSNSTFSNLFEKHYPNRFFECRIAEQNMISVAAGLAATGKVPFASSFAKFIARGTDQIDLAVISRANIKLVGSHAGVSLGADGPSQMGLSDVAYFRSLTRASTGCRQTSRDREGAVSSGDRGGVACHVFHPSDAICAYRCVELMASIDGMCYLRTHRPDAPFLYPFDEKFEIGGCKRPRTGEHLTLVSSGFILHTVLQAAERLAEDGIHCNVFDAYTFPLDATPILNIAEKAGGAVLTVEDNYAGGLHAELAEAAARYGGIRVEGMTVNRIPKSAKTADEVFDYVGVGLEQIIRQATALAR